MLISYNYYPLQNPSYITYDSLLQMSPTITPFLDARLINLQLKMPKKYQVRKNLINSAVKKISTELSQIPHPSTRAPIKYPKTISLITKHLYELLKKYDLKTPKPYYSHGPWTDHNQLLRTHKFAQQKIKEKKELIEDANFLNYNDIEETLEKQEEGKNYSNEIYRLLTFINSTAIQSKK